MKEKKPKTGLRPYTKRELADLYEMMPRAFYSLFKPHEEFIGVKNGRYYSPLQVEMIFKRIGLPPCMLSDQYIISDENKLKSNAIAS